MALSTRQPFAEIGTPRLQALQSAKNRQNAITPSFSSPLKQTLGPTKPATGKRRAPSVFEDEDSENVDPSIFNSPTKKSKTSDGFSKPSFSPSFSLLTSPSKPSQSAITTTPSIPSVRKALSSPKTSNCTPVSLSRGSPKHKRVGLLSKRRASSSPFRRVDPPSFSHSSPALPFSIDAALKGSIPDYTPKPAVATPSYDSTIEDSMPKSWIFDIYEDTPEQEAANLMEHSASVLDISSDDDFETKRRNEELERGKENIPPPDFMPSQSAHVSADSMETGEPVVTEHVKLPRLRKIAQDAMDEDRSPLSDLPPADFYGEGLDATSYVTVDAGIERPSGLSKEFDFSVPSPKKEPAEAETVESVVEESTQAPVEEEPIAIFSDETATCELSVTVKEEVSSVLEVLPEQEPVMTLAAP